MCTLQCLLWFVFVKRNIWLQSRFTPLASWMTTHCVSSRVIFPYLVNCLRSNHNWSLGISWIWHALTNLMVERIEIYQEGSQQVNPPVAKRAMTASIAKNADWNDFSPRWNIHQPATDLRTSRRSWDQVINLLQPSRTYISEKSVLAALSCMSPGGTRFLIHLPQWFHNLPGRTCPSN
jgi:hypothetical protein